jgi:hypothetical protein
MIFQFWKKVIENLDQKNDLLTQCRFFDPTGAVIAQTNRSDYRIFDISTTPEIADYLWGNQKVIRKYAEQHGIEVITLTGGHLRFTIKVAPSKQVQDLREISLLHMAIDSAHGYAVVRLQDNVVIQAGPNVTRLCNVPASRWAGFDITPLWSPNGDSWLQYINGECSRSSDLDKIYHSLEWRPGNTGLFIPNIEYTAYLGQFQKGTLVRGAKARLCADIYRLDRLFGEPCRLCITKAVEAL